MCGDWREHGCGSKSIPYFFTNPVELVISDAPISPHSDVMFQWHQIYVSYVTDPWILPGKSTIWTRPTHIWFHLIPSIMILSGQSFRDRADEPSR